MHRPTDRIPHTTASVTPDMEHWMEREIAQWIDHESRPTACSYHAAEIEASAPVYGDGYKTPIELEASVPVYGDGYTHHPLN